MDITYVFYTDYSVDVAHGKQILHTCNALSRDGHELTVVCAGDIEAYAREHGIPIEFDVIRSPIRLPTSRSDRVVSYLTALRSARQSDVIYTRDIRFLKFLSLVPGIHTVHPPIIYEAHKAHHHLEKMSGRQERRYVDVADVVVTISEGVREDLAKIGVEVTDIIPDAAPFELVPQESKTELRTKLTLDQDATIFVYSGSFKFWKNDLELVLEGMASVVSKHDVHVLFIGGAEAQVEQLREYGRSAGIPDERITFTGRIPHEHVFSYLKASDVGLVPLRSTNEQSSKYTSPLKLYEYLISGLAIVASDVPAIASIAEGTANVFLYSTGEMESFVKCCESVLDEECNRDPPTKYSYEERARSIDRLLNHID